MNVALSNAFVIFKNRPDSNITYLAFLSSITTALVNEEKVKKRISPAINSNRKRKIQFGLPNKNEPHLPIVSASGRCAFCSTNKNQYRSSYHCSHCNRAFCMNSKRNCFYKYHKNLV